MELTRQERNDLFEVLSKNGVDPADCRMDVTEGTRFAPIKVWIWHKPTGSDFTLYVQPGNYRYEWHVHDGPNSGGHYPCKTWEDALDQLGYWAEQAQYVADTPDFWRELKRAPEILAAAQQGEASNTPFTPDERAQISNRLDEIKQLVRQKFELPAQQLAAIEQRLDDAEEASKRLGRKDWMMMFYGGVVSTFMTDAVPPGVIQTVLTTLMHGIGHIFGIGGPPPIIST